MAHDGNRLLTFEWVVSLAWAIFWGALGYVAIVKRDITLGGRSITHYEGISAVIAGFVMIGVALLGISWLFRLSPFRRHAQFLLCMAWTVGATVYFSWFYP